MISRLVNRKWDTMKLYKKIFQIIYKDSLKYYVLLQKKKVSLLSFSKMIEEEDVDMITNLDTISFQKKYYEGHYTKLDCIDEFLEYSNNSEKYYHLREIRNIVHLEDMLGKVLDDKVYQRALDFYYLRRFFQKLFEKNTNLKITYYPLIEEENRKLIEMITKRIDNYYIELITK